MSDQVKSAIRSVLKVGGGYLVAKGITENSTVEIAIAGVVALAGIAWSWTHHQAEATAK